MKRTWLNPVWRSEIRTDVIRLATWAALALLLGASLNASRPGGLPLHPGPGQRAGVPTWVWQRLHFADVSAAHAETTRGGAILVDVRDTRDYLQAHARGALSLPYRDYGRALPEFLARARPDSRLYLYCYGSECGLSMRVANRLIQSGFTDVTTVGGGFAAWQQAHLPIKKGR
jgi:rhodanese-related sulfurtransferase